MNIHFVNINKKTTYLIFMKTEDFLNHQYLENQMTRVEGKLELLIVAEMTALRRIILGKLRKMQKSKKIV